MRKLLLAALVCLLGAPVFADANVKLGKLTCRLTDVENDIVYTDEKFACSFEPEEGKVESYIGQIKQVGVDLSVVKNYTLVWYVVTGSLNTYKPGDMAGTYVGASAEVSAGEGAGADWLTGGFNQEINLQPWAVGSDSGDGVSLGIEEFELK